MQVRRLVAVQVKKRTLTQRNDGTYGETYGSATTYQCVPQDITDEVAVASYGADISKMVRLSSIAHALEKFFKQKMNNDTDNVTDYIVVHNSQNYHVKAVTDNWVDITL